MYNINVVQSCWNFVQLKKWENKQVLPKFEVSNSKNKKMVQLSFFRRFGNMEDTPLKGKNRNNLSHNSNWDNISTHGTYFLRLNPCFYSRLSLLGPKKLNSDRLTYLDKV